MRAKRTEILMAILLVMVLGYLARPVWEPYFGIINVQKSAPTLSGTNTISKVTVQQNEKGAWEASIDYFYTGKPAAAYLSVRAVEKDSPEDNQSYKFFTVLAQQGKQHIVTPIFHPGDSNLHTKQVTVWLVSQSGPITGQKIDQVIDWPDAQTWHQNQALANKPNDELLKKAISLIDSGVEFQINEAKAILERIIANDKKFEPAYIELARVAMKTNWGPEGLHQAEGYLNSALQIQPNSTNAKILMGYVYTHQGRYPAAEQLFKEAATDNPKNLWLWANWGQLFALQGKFEAAEQKYKEAINRPRTYDTYDRARLDAYQNLFVLLDRRKDLDGTEALHKQRISEFGAGNCYGAEYARFVMLERESLDTAISLARQAINANCSTDEARFTLGLGYYWVWSKSQGERKNEAFNQAKIYLPPGPKAFYVLASSDKTISVAQSLISTGEKIDQTDNNRMNALSYAIVQKDISTAKRLMQLGANTNALIGNENMPISLLPVMIEDVTLVKLMQQSGVDYSKIRFQGMSGTEIVRRSGNAKLLEQVEGKAAML